MSVRWFWIAVQNYCFFMTWQWLVPWLVGQLSPDLWNGVGKNGWRWSFSEKFRKTPPKKCAIVRHSAPAQKGAFENLQHPFFRSNFAASFVSASDGVSVFIPRGNTELFNHRESLCEALEFEHGHGFILLSTIVFLWKSKIFSALTWRRSRRRRVFNLVKAAKVCSLWRKKVRSLCS